jgi:hypothetical protein
MIGQPRRAARVDESQAAVVKALEKAGALVWAIGQPFDLLVHFRGNWHVLEVKSYKGRLTKAQNRAVAALQAQGGMPPAVRVVHDAIEALAAIGWLRGADCS